MKRCKICVLPEGFPHISFNAQGVCGLCQDRTGRGERKRLERAYRSRFEALIGRARRQRAEYDVLVAYSGGKDSTYTLSLLKEAYGLNPLAFTLNNGFIPHETFLNIRGVVEKLGVDHIFFRPRFDILRKIFRYTLQNSPYPKKSLERASAVCTSCIGLVKYAALKTAIEKKIPLVAFGWSPGQAPIASSILKLAPRMVSSMEKVIKDPLVRIGGKGVEAYFLNKRHYAAKADFPYLVHPLAFLGYDEAKAAKKIKAFGWKAPEGVDLNSTNCLLNSLANAAHIKECGWHPYVFEMAELVRGGYMSRREGLRRIQSAGNKKTIDMVKERLEMPK